jgi:hypothetical protein
MGGTIDGAGMKIGRKRRMRLGMWLLLLLPVAIVFVVCYRPVMRLKAQPPSDFVETNKQWDAARQSAEERAAQAYWQLAINLVQWRFVFGSELPGQPPEEFKLAEKDFRSNSIATAPATRIHYWNKLRTVWTQPQAWSETYVWNTDWLREFLSKFMDSAVHFTDGLLSRLRK